MQYLKKLLLRIQLFEAKCMLRTSRSDLVRNVKERDILRKEIEALIDRVAQLRGKVGHL